MSRRQWNALYTRPRFERKIDDELKKKDITSYLPETSVVRQWSDRRKKVSVPLYPSYVFIRVNPFERYQAVQTDGVIRVVTFDRSPAVIPETQIDNIRQLLRHGFLPQPHRYLAIGDEVEVMSGPLRGIRGVLAEERGDSKLVLSLHSIRQSVGVVVDRQLLRKLSKQFHGTSRREYQK